MQRSRPRFINIWNQILGYTIFGRNLQKKSHRAFVWHVYDVDFLVFSGIHAGDEMDPTVSWALRAFL